jgi:PAS domain S-box-containing protein
MFRMQVAPDGTVQFLSVGEALWDLAGVYAAECITDADTLWHRIHVEDRAGVRDAYTVGAATLQPWFTEFRTEGPDGRPRWLRAAARPVRDASGAVIHSGVVVDVSEGRWVEDALMSRPDEPSETSGDAFLRGLAEHMGRALRADAAAVVEVDVDQAKGARIVAAWTSFRPLESAAEELNGGPFREVLRSGMRTWQAAVRDRFPRDELLVALNAEGFSGIPLVDAHGRTIGALGAWFRTPIAAVAKTESMLAVFAHRAAMQLERRRADEELRRSESLLRGIVDNTSALVFVKDLEGRYLLVNRQWCDAFETTPEKVLSRTDHEMFPASLADQYRANDRLSLAVGNETISEEETSERDGPHTYISVKFPLRDGQGRPFATGGISTDITDRKRTERDLVEERSFITTVLEMTGSLVIVADVEGRVTRLNQAGEQTLGWSADAAVGRPIEEVLVPSDRGDAVRRTLRWLREGGEPVHHEGDWLARDGTIRRIAMTGGTIRDANGSVRWVIATGQDVTERHRLEIQLARAHRLEGLGRLAGGIAHDFNNLLTPILGYTDLLLSDLPAGDRRAERLRQIHEAAERARNLTRQLLAFGRGQVMERRPVHLGEVLESFGRILRRTIREDIGIATTVDPGCGSVVADPTQIEQILLNLALNAQDAMPGGGTLSLEVRDVEIDATWSARSQGLRPGRYVRLTVSDDGAGMDAETQRHMFEPFFTTKETGKGTGLGLATVYGIVHQLEGVVEVRSAPGAGTTFRIFLPRLEHEPAAAEPSRIPAPVARGHETVLVVEDNDMVRGLAVDVLREHGYTVLDALGPAEGLAMLEDPGRIVHLLLTDLIMPGFDGRELVRRAQAIRPGLRVVYMSGYADHIVERHGLQAGDVPFLHKPFSVAALTGRVREVLDAH